MISDSFTTSSIFLTFLLGQVILLCDGHLKKFDLDPHLRAKHRHPPLDHGELSKEEAGQEDDNCVGEGKEEIVEIEKADILNVNSDKTKQYKCEPYVQVLYPNCPLHLHF